MLPHDILQLVITNFSWWRKFPPQKKNLIIRESNTKSTIMHFIKKKKKKYNYTHGTHKYDTFNIVMIRAAKNKKHELTRMNNNKMEINWWEGIYIGIRWTKMVSCGWRWQNGPNFHLFSKSSGHKFLFFLKYQLNLDSQCEFDFKC